MMGHRSQQTASPEGHEISSRNQENQQAGPDAFTVDRRRWRPWPVHPNGAVQTEPRLIGRRRAGKREKLYAGSSA